MALILPAGRRRARRLGVTVSTTSDSGYQAASASYSWSHVNTGNFLTVDVARLSVPGTTVTAVTFNSVGLTRLGGQSTGTDAGSVECWGLVAPTVGTFTIAVTLSAVAISASCAVSYSGVHQTSPVESFASAQGTNVGAADAEVTVTSVASSCLIHAAVATDDGNVTAGQTARGEVNGAGGSGGSEDFGPQAAGAKLMNYTDIAALATWAIAGYALRPLAASSLTTVRPRRMLSGVG